MKEEDREQLAMDAAAKVHETWCEGELRAFYERFSAAMKGAEKPADALAEACNKNGKPRNEIELDTDWLMGHTTAATSALKTFEGFLNLVKAKVISVKRFTKRTLTEEEQKRVGKGNYNAQTQEENILRLSKNCRQILKEKTWRLQKVLCLFMKNMQREK